LELQIMGRWYCMKRNSNFELLRVVAMLMVIAFHIYAHCVSEQLTGGGNAAFSAPVFHMELLILAALSPLGKVGNAIFLILSGYFLVQKGKDTDLVKISKKLVFQQAFAAIVLMVASTLAFNCLNGVDGFYPNVIDITHFNNGAWFIGYYFAVIVIGKIFLNGFLSRLDRKQYLSLLFALFTIVQFWWTTYLLYGISTGLVLLCTGIFLYSLGGYLKEYNPFQNVKSIYLIVLIVVVFLFVFLANYNSSINDIRKYIVEGEYVQNIIQFEDNHFVPIILGTAFFELFRRIEIPSNKVINYLGEATFMVYLLHDNSFVYSIWNTQDWITLLYVNPGLYLLKHFGWTLAVFVIGVLVYSAYVGLQNVVKKIAPVITNNSVE